MGLFNKYLLIGFLFIFGFMKRDIIVGSHEASGW